MTDWFTNPAARMYVENGGGFPVLETQNPTAGFTPANVDQIVSDVNIEFKISVEFYDHAGFPMVSALGRPAEYR